MIGKFLKKTLLFLLIVPAVFLIGMLLPPTPLAKEYLLTTKPHKDSLLQFEKKPRIIFVAGSSMAFGLDSQKIKDSIHRNPINMGLHGGVGLFYMMDHTAKFIKPGDIVVLVAEYHQFYGDFTNGGEQLLRVIFDNAQPSEALDLRWIQIKKTYPYLPKYALLKFSPAEYFNLKMSEVYSKNAFNYYGDAVAHWNKPSINKTVFQFIEGGDFRQDVVDALVEYGNIVKSKGATLYVSYPPFQQSSFDNCRKQIDVLENSLKRSGLTLIGTPERYRLPDDLLFDTPYHPTKAGVDQRTNLLVQDLKAQIQKDGLAPR